MTRTSADLDVAVVWRALQHHETHNYSHGQPLEAFDRIMRRLHTLETYERGRKIAEQAGQTRRPQ